MITEMIGNKEGRAQISWRKNRYLFSRVGILEGRKRRYLGDLLSNKNKSTGRRCTLV
jgi:hypothetical protein